MTTTTTTTTTRTWSDEQNAIYAWFEASTSEHLIVRARAGCGKTTTIVEGVDRAPETSILVCAYNKKIAEELVARVKNPNVTVKTLHAVGFAAVRRFRDRIKCDFGSGRADNLTDKVCGVSAPDAIKKLVSKLHTKGREIAPHATTLGDLTTIAINFECVPDESWSDAGFSLVYVEQKALDAMKLAADVKAGDTIDGSDMIFLPVRNGWLTKSFGLVVVDEAQDMTNAQLEIAQGVCNGRICVVGDNMQAIYGFRGADSESLDRLKSELDARELGLTTTYRCGKQIVALAKSYVDDFTAGPNNPEGEIVDLPFELLTSSASASDFILSRVNAPLVAVAMKLLRAGKRTRIAGRDIGAGLQSLIRKFRARSVADLLVKIAAWERKEVARFEPMMQKATNGRKASLNAKLDAIHDQAEMLISLTDGSTSVSDVEARIAALFTDDGLGDAGLITCSSVHKAKGLEANRVFVLTETLRSNTQEEKNICYVAYTRAKTTLVMVAPAQK